jgi:hypothetical protein
MKEHYPGRENFNGIQSLRPVQTRLLKDISLQGYLVFSCLLTSSSFPKEKEEGERKMPRSYLEYISI